MVNMIILSIIVYCDMLLTIIHYDYPPALRPNEAKQVLDKDGIVQIIIYYNL